MTDIDLQASDGRTQEPIETDQTRARYAPDRGIAPLFAALAQAQGAFPEIPKNRTATVRMKKGGSFSFKYSDISDLIKATRPHLSAAGLAVFQAPSEDLKFCITTLAHKSGLSLTVQYPIKHGGAEDRLNPGQDWAISWAYARRYGMFGLLGCASEETIEGNVSQKTSPDFEAASGDGILSVRGVVVPAGATKAEIAKIYADGIEVQLKEAKTQVGLDGAYGRNQEVIDAMQDHSWENYANVDACYAVCKRDLASETRES